MWTPFVYINTITLFFITISMKLLTTTKRLNTYIIRKCSNVVKRDLQVPPFCEVYINVPYNLIIKPLNVHKYPNCDKLLIQNNAKFEKSLECIIGGNHITIFDKSEDTNNIAQVEIPVKSNLFVSSRKDIDLGQLNCDKINLKSVEGNISVDKFNGKSIQIISKNGNIKLKDAIQASEIQVVVTENGSINTGKLQGISSRLETNKGDITVESSYCNESVFKTCNGDLSLSNIHQHCEIIIKEGHLNITSFDGQLTATVDKGDADIHLSRITGNSEVNIKNGSLHLKLAELCQDYIKFILKSDYCDVGKQFKFDYREPGCVIINPEVVEEYLAVVNCLQGSILVQNVSWQEMMKLKLKKFHSDQDATV
ncbi:protein FAM185A-like [Diorhabda sublineata]|uniref:protein FAM185A-like n=1 Tax=Diorhabda sublineata TaxID=1163346 RepID=UPI0024E15501|nr:protein FAM185A-like [Diorhabda sublineata]